MSASLLQRFSAQPQCIIGNGRFFAKNVRIQEFQPRRYNLYFRSESAPRKSLASAPVREFGKVASIFGDDIFRRQFSVFGHLPQNFQHFFLRLLRRNRRTTSRKAALAENLQPAKKVSKSNFYEMALFIIITPRFFDAKKI